MLLVATLLLTIDTQICGMQGLFLAYGRGYIKKFSSVVSPHCIVRVRSSYKMDTINQLPSTLTLTSTAFTITITTLLITYITLVRILRYKNLQSIQRKYGKYTQNPYAMDYKTAHAILKTVFLREFPFIYGFGTQFALIKSYGVASGTQLLVHTRRLTSKRTVGKRAEDTGVFIAEFLVSGIDTPRGLKALAKMNWIHRQYGSKITNGEMVHTLALFVLEPQRWIDKYEWRPLTEIERVAIFTYWREIGNRMGMRDIPRTLEEFKTWTADFEEKNMRFAESNRKCVLATLDLFVRPLPGFMQQIITDKVFPTFIEPHVRPVLGLRDPPFVVEKGMEWFFFIRKLLIRYLFLPRWSDVDAVGRENESGRVVRTVYLFEPWYVAETVWSFVLKTVLGRIAKRAPGPEFMSEGYLPEELGPVEFRDRSRDDVLAEAEGLKEYAQRGGGVGIGCPFGPAYR